MHKLGEYYRPLHFNFNLRSCDLRSNLHPSSIVHHMHVSMLYAYPRGEGGVIKYLPSKHVPALHVDPMPALLLQPVEFDQVELHLRQMPANSALATVFGLR